MRRKFLDLFPPPKFLETPFTGLDISDDALRFIKLERRHGRLELTGYGEKVLPPGLLTAGVINDEKALAQALEDFRKQFRLNFVRVALPDEKTFVFRTEVPQGDAVVLRQSVEFTIEDNVPLPVQETYFDFRVIARQKQLDHVGVVVVVVSQNTVESYSRVLAQSGFNPLLLGIESDCIARTVIPSGDDRRSLVINMEKDKTGLYIVSKGLVHFTSIVAGGVQSLETPKNLSYINENSPRSQRRRLIPPLISEIEKVYDYLRNHKISLGENKNIESIIIISNDIADAKRALSACAVFKTPARLADVWTNAFSFEEFIPPIPFEESFRYAVAVGLAIPYVARNNN